jgi:hypothetical protein
MLMISKFELLPRDKITLRLIDGGKKSMVRKRDLEKYILAGEIRQYNDLQVFEFKGKDARGYNFGVQLSPVEALPLMKEPQSVNADRVKVYVGGDPNNIKQIDTEIEISMGKELEVYTIDSAAMTYIPKGTSHKQRVLKKPKKNSWVLSLTLPPKYVEPAKPKK